MVPCIVLSEQLELSSVVSFKHVKAHIEMKYVLPGARIRSCSGKYGDGFHHVGRARQ